jgi:DNA-binding CsgD family transcriptional regulator
MPTLKQTYQDVYLRLRQQNYGEVLPEFDQLPLPPFVSTAFERSMPMWLLVGNFKNERIHHVSSNIEALTGWPAKWYLEVGVAGAFGLLHPDDVDLISRSSQEILSWMKQVPIEQVRTHAMISTYRLRRPDGSYRWWQSHQNGLYYTEEGAMLYFANWSTSVQEIYRLSVPTCRLQYTDSTGATVMVSLPTANPNTPSLTVRELEVLRHVADGLTSHQIADRLGISKTTVDTHRQHLLAKTDSRNTVELMNIATALGLH